MVPLVAPLPTGEGYEGTLFVAQLTEAGLRTIDAQETAFFNAEILARDLGNRGVPEDVGTLAEIDAGIWALWEEGVAAAGTPQDDKSPRTWVRGEQAETPISKVKAPAITSRVLKQERLHAEDVIEKVDGQFSVGSVPTTRSFGEGVKATISWLLGDSSLPRTRCPAH